MNQRCEVCSTLPAAGAPRQKLKRVLVEGRVIVLCKEHATRLLDADVSSLSALRALFREPGGKRSLLDRRTPLDRRIFPARPEGRRRGPGRRRDDH